jgi:hypothetical protein
MTTHLFIPGILLQPGFIHQAHDQYLRDWREDAIRRADDGDVAASVCLQATFIDLALFGKPRHDWLGIMDEFLTADGLPLAYSEAFGRRLYKFGGQYRQSTIQAIHTRWWIEVLNGVAEKSRARLSSLVKAKTQSDGLIYDVDVSETILRHRMKTELTMSMAMGLEVMMDAKDLAIAEAKGYAANIVAPSKCPMLGYISMEYFRHRALNVLGHPELFPPSTAANLNGCAANLNVGWCDFAITTKVDAYMGTAKRTQRDKPIHSPLIACQALWLINKTLATADQGPFRQRALDYAQHLEAHPTDIPAFQMRDVPIPFGADRTPIESIAASHLIASRNTI